MKNQKIKPNKPVKSNNKQGRQLTDTIEPYLLYHDQSAQTQAQSLYRYKKAENNPLSKRKAEAKYNNVRRGCVESHLIPSHYEIILNQPRRIQNNFLQYLRNRERTTGQTDFIIDVRKWLSEFEAKDKVEDFRVIGERLGISYREAYNTYVRAIQKIRRLLKERGLDKSFFSDYLS